LVHLSATVEMQPSAVALPELPLMLILGWYLIVMMYMDAAAVASTGSTSAV
jgi:hypothetical protein